MCLGNGKCVLYSKSSFIQRITFTPLALMHFILSNQRTITGYTGQPVLSYKFFDYKVLLKMSPIFLRFCWKYKGLIFAGNAFSLCKLKMFLPPLQTHNFNFYMGGFPVFLPDKKFAREIFLIIIVVTHIYYKIYDNLLFFFSHQGLTETPTLTFPSNVSKLIGNRMYNM